MSKDRHLHIVIRGHDYHPHGPAAHTDAYYHQMPWWFLLFWTVAIALCLGFWYGVYKLVAWAV